MEPIHAMKVMPERPMLRRTLPLLGFRRRIKMEALGVLNSVRCVLEGPDQHDQRDSAETQKSDDQLCDKGNHDGAMWASSYLFPSDQPLHGLSGLAHILHFLRWACRRVYGDCQEKARAAVSDSGEAKDKSILAECLSVLN